MLKSGKEHLESLRDGRIVYIGSERVDDVTTHPAFRNAAHTIAGIYDFKSAPENQEALTFDDAGRRYSAYFLPARNRTDLERRTDAHRAIADLTYGLIGRSPDHVSSFVTGMFTRPEVFGEFSGNLSGYYAHMRDEDVYAVYAVIPPQAARDPEFYQRGNARVPALRVVREDDDGVVVSGMKMLATGAVFANEIWIGNLIPLAPDQLDQSITCAVPVNAPGLSLWSRKPFEADAPREFDNPLAYRYDESDSMVVCDEVRVPWERVFVHNDAVKARSIYIDTPGHCYGNHQANVRFWSKLRLIVGLANRVTRYSGADRIPAVQEILGRLAALEATLGGMIMGQIQAAESWPDGYATFNRRFVYAALNWCTENHSAIIDILRDLCGGSVFQMPANVSVMEDENLAETFQSYWSTPQAHALDRMKLFRLAWDLVGSEFAGRHQQYEKFYAGASFIVRNYSYTHAPWDEYDAIVDGLMGGYAHPGEYFHAAAAVR